MKKILDMNGNTVFIGTPWYVYMGENGCWQHSEGDDPIEAVSVHGTLYRLNEDDVLPDREAELCYITDADDGELLLDSIKTAIATMEIENGMCEAAITTEQRLADIEQAICELAMNGGN